MKRKPARQMKFVPIIRTLEFILTGLNIIIRDYDAEVVKAFGRNHRWMDGSGSAQNDEKSLPDDRGFQLVG